MNPVADDDWRPPRQVSVVVDNDSWILPYARELVGRIAEGGDHAVLARSHAEIPEGLVAFYLGCLHITPPTVLRRNRFNLVVHESDLPQGRGFAPLFWAILNGADTVTACLIEAADEVDAGPIYARATMRFEGTELEPELREVQGRTSIELCLDFLARSEPPRPERQTGDPTWLPRRRPKDSRLDPDGTLREQFDLLRIVSNTDFPAFFELRGRRYRLAIHDDGPAKEPRDA